MPSHIDNAFIASERAADRRLGLHPLRVSLAPLLADQRETLAAIGAATRWCTMRMSPMRLVDATLAWCSLGGLETSETVLMNPTFQRQADSGARKEMAAGLREAASMVEAGPRSTVIAIDETCAVVGDKPLAKFAQHSPMSAVTLVRVGGAVEPADALAIRAAVRAGRHPVLADFRVTHVLRLVDDRDSTFETFEEDMAVLIVADNLRNYLAALLNTDVDNIGWPRPSMVMRLLSVSGSFVVRPIETERFGSFVDVGVCTSRDESSPARQSLIYDMPSGSWHDER